MSYSSSYAEVVQKYSKQARSYDRRWNLRWGEQTLRAAVEAAPWDRAARVLDVGCGTGELEVAVRDRLRGALRLTGVDIAPAMLRLAAEKLRGLSAVTWTAAPAEQLPFAAESFDTLICNNSFHYYRQPRAVLNEFHRVLRRGGTLVLSDWCGDFLTNQISQWVLYAAHHTRLHRYSLERCYGSREMATLLHDAGFSIQKLRKLGLEWGWGIMVFTATA